MRPGTACTPSTSPEKLARETGAPESKHPAHKVFKANPVFDEPVTNDVLKGMF